MITRPLDLNSKLSPPPRSFDWVHFVNFTLIAMFFMLFGSRFVLTPAIVVDGGDFHAPVRAPDRIAYVPGTTVISVKANGQIFTDTGLVSHAQLQAWLEEKIASSPDASLLVRADAGVMIEEVIRIYELASSIGFARVSIPVVPGKTDGAPSPATP